MAEIDLGEAVSPSERRTSERKKLIVDVRFDGGDGTGIANTRDIGVGGMYMTTTADLDTGMPIMMTISINGQKLDLKGVVVYSDPGHGVGVRFKDLNESDEGILRQELALM
ncbi:MAG: PilZ domain-containing protein [Chloracidobacterium sp.]|nr:PilZ domain-containing protein [Chloracidobacterium sp.]